MPRYVFANATASVRVGSWPERIQRGEARYVDDPVVLAHPDYFQPDPVIVAKTSGWEPQPEAEVEQATANPGEKRTVRRGD